MDKLPSGSYREWVYLGKDASGKNIYKSVTGKTKAEAKLKAAEVLSEKKIDRSEQSILFSTAFDDLLASKDKVLSVNTMKGYRTIKKSFTYFDGKKVSEITQMDMQAAINDYAADHSPKSCRNAYSVVITVLKSVDKTIAFDIKLPQKKRYEVLVPTKEHVKLLMDSADEDTRRAIMLAAFGPMRRGEVCALKYEDIEKDTVHVHATMAQDEHGAYHYKDTPKSSAGDRYILYPHKLIKELGKGKGYIIKINPETLYFRFRALCKKLGLPPYRFHDLRVYGASMLHETMPNAYIMERGGWETESVLVEIYRKSMPDEKKKLTKKLNDDISSSFF